MQQDAVSGFSTAQIEFLAEDQEITIVPQANLPQLDFISGSIGPLVQLQPVKVPLWLAIMLRKRQLCRIMIPSWLDRDFLNAKKQQESGETNFQELPFHYIEIHSLLLNNAPEDLAPNSTDLRLLLEDIISERQRKFRSGLRSIDGPTDAVKLNNASAVELNTLRPFFIAAMNQFTELRKVEDALDQKTNETETEESSIRQIRKRRKN